MAASSLRFVRWLCPWGYIEDWKHRTTATIKINYNRTTSVLGHLISVHVLRKFLLNLRQWDGLGKVTEQCCTFGSNVSFSAIGRRSRVLWPQKNVNIFFSGAINMMWFKKKTWNPCPLSISARPEFRHSGARTINSNSCLLPASTITLRYVTTVIGS